MNKIFTVRMLSFFIIVMSVIAIFNFKSIFPSWMSLKLIEAISFFLCGITLYLIDLSIEGKSRASDILPFTCVTIFLLMITASISSFSNINIELDNFFIIEKQSIPIIPVLILVAITGFITSYDRKKCKNIINIFGIISILTGTVGIFKISWLSSGI